MQAPIAVDFPLRGEWFAPNTPGTKVPSHGTDMFGERYAYDFVGLEPGNSSMRFYRPNPLSYFIIGVHLKDCYGWGQPIYSATPGTVIQAADGWPERDPVHLIRDLTVMVKNGLTVDPRKTTDLRFLTGNHITVEFSDGIALYAHAQNGSIRVAVGDKVTPGQHIASVGHSGNSTAPHLHFQLMDNADPWKAQGIPCCFKEYEIFEEGKWIRKENEMPKASERVKRI